MKTILTVYFIKAEIVNVLPFQHRFNTILNTEYDEENILYSFFFSTKSLKSSVYFILTARLSSDQLGFQRSLATRGWW